MAKEDDREWTVRNGDRLSGAVLLMLGLYIAYEALQLRFGSVTRPGPGFYPMVLALLLVGVSGAVFFRSLWPRNEMLRVAFTARSSHLVITGVAVIIYAAVLELGGFLLCTFLLVLMLLVGIGRVPWFRSLLIAGGGTVAFYVIFTQLGIPLPNGILGF